MGGKQIHLTQYPQPQATAKGVSISGWVAGRLAEHATTSRLLWWTLMPANYSGVSRQSYVVPPGEHS